MDGVGDDGLMVNGKSADYMGIEGALRYRAQIKAVPEGGSIREEETQLVVENADAVTLYFVAATNFVDYKDVSADQVERVDECLKNGSHINELDDLGRTPLHTAAYMRNRVMFDWLEEQGGDPDARDDYGWTPLKLLSLRLVSM